MRIHIRTIFLIAIFQKKIKKRKGALPTIEDGLIVTAKFSVHVTDYTYARLALKGIENWQQSR